MLDIILHEKKISIRELSKSSGISEATLFRAKKDIGAMSFKNIRKICAVLRITPNELAFRFCAEKKENDKVQEYEKNRLPEFANREKNYILDMLNGSLYDGQIEPQTYLQTKVYDSDYFDGLGKKWHIKDVAFLAAKCKMLSPNQAYTIIKLVRDWWDNPDNNEDDTSKIF